MNGLYFLLSMTAIFCAVYGFVYRETRKSNCGVVTENPADGDKDSDWCDQIELRMGVGHMRADGKIGPPMGLVDRSGIVWVAVDAAGPR